MSDNAAPLRSSNEFSSVFEAHACFAVYCGASSSQTEVTGPCRGINVAGILHSALLLDAIEMQRQHYLVIFAVRIFSRKCYHLHFKGLLLLESYLI